ncbi:MAG TPA: HIT family protein [Burkholderiales bacterium]|nr:HIT family protein [Burkholderiales bacterium]
MTKPCRFCNLSSTDIVIANELAVVSRDSYPVSPGHTLVIPKRHVGSFFDTTTEERLALLELIDKAKLELDREFHPAAYNLGLNDGPAAGQSIPHVHFHLIPRYEGDRTDARGGVRWVLPEKAKYWK